MASRDLARADPAMANPVVSAARTATAARRFTFLIPSDTAIWTTGATADAFARLDDSLAQIRARQALPYRAAEKFSI